MADGTVATQVGWLPVMSTRTICSIITPLACDNESTTTVPPWLGTATIAYQNMVTDTRSFPP